MPNHHQWAHEPNKHVRSRYQEWFQSFIKTKCPVLLIFFLIKDSECFAITVLSYPCPLSQITSCCQLGVAPPGPVNWVTASWLQVEKIRNDRSIILRMPPILALIWVQITWKYNMEEQIWLQVRSVPFALIFVLCCMCSLLLALTITSPDWMHETVIGAGALGWPRGLGWGGRWEGGSGWGTHVNPWLIHVNVWQKPLQSCKVISLQLIKIIGGIKKVAYSLKYTG